jgi:hypothetical protein
MPMSGTTIEAGSTPSPICLYSERLAATSFKRGPGADAFTARCGATAYASTWLVCRQTVEVSLARNGVRGSILQRFGRVVGDSDNGDPKPHWPARTVMRQYRQPGLQVPGPSEAPWAAGANGEHSLRVDANFGAKQPSDIVALRGSATAIATGQCFRFFLMLR